METDSKKLEVRFELVDPESDDALTALHAYFEELAARFSDGFEPGDTLTNPYAGRWFEKPLT